MRNSFFLKEKTILITGASSGIERSIAIKYSKIGANMVITARNVEGLHEIFQL